MAARVASTPDEESSRITARLIEGFYESHYEERLPSGRFTYRAVYAWPELNSGESHTARTAYGAATSRIFTDALCNAPIIREW
jgi:hypothetical protein